MVAPRQREISINHGRTLRKLLAPRNLAGKPAKPRLGTPIDARGKQAVDTARTSWTADWRT